MPQFFPYYFINQISFMFCCVSLMIYINSCFMIPNFLELYISSYYTLNF